MVHAHVRVCEDHLLEGPVGAHSKGGPEVRGDGQGGVAARLEHALPLALVGLHGPLVDGTVHAAGDQTAVVWAPDDAADLRRGRGEEEGRGREEGRRGGGEERRRGEEGK